MSLWETGAVPKESVVGLDESEAVPNESGAVPDESVADPTEWWCCRYL